MKQSWSSQLPSSAAGATARSRAGRQTKGKQKENKQIMQCWIFSSSSFSAAGGSKVKSREVHTLNLTLPFSKDKQTKGEKVQKLKHKQTNKQTGKQAIKKVLRQRACARVTGVVGWPAGTHCPLVTPPPRRRLVVRLEAKFRFSEAGPTPGWSRDTWRAWRPPLPLALPGPD